jgi:peptidoglycan/LPS O-acetylase OafA/YrhL
MGITNNIKIDGPNNLPNYRADIDGLRAVAILSVVLFHAFPSFLHGGFVGVDVFFVISGFLISNIIFRELHLNKFSFLDFYIHRAKRIFPSLIVVLISSYLIGWFVLLPDEFMQLGKHIAAGAGFVQNFILRKEVGYFETAADLKPLLHLWSLAIEEQFYLLFPLLIFAAWRSKLFVFIAIISLTAISFSLNIFGVTSNPVKTFFLPQTRIWELLAGSILAYFQFFKKDDYKKLVFTNLIEKLPSKSFKNNNNIINKRKDIISAIGLLLIVIAILYANKEKAFPGWLALLPVSGTTLLILAGTDGIINRTILSSKFFVFVGLISYPLYLWHWPILAFAKIIEGQELSYIIRIIAIFSSFLLAWLTYKFIEKPIRFNKSIKKIPLYLTSILLMVGVVGYITFKNNGFEFRTKQISNFTEAINDWNYPGDLSKKSINGINYFYKESGKKTITLFIGDSNIEQYLPRVDSLIRNNPGQTNGVIFKTGGGCLAIPGQIPNEKHKHCLNLMQDALTIADENSNIDTVVIGSFWNGYLAHGGPMAKKYGTESDEYKDALIKLSQYIEKLKSTKKRVFLILNIPMGKELAPRNLISRDLKDFPNVFSISVGEVSRTQLTKSYGKIESDLINLAKSTGAIAINPLDFLCESSCSSVDSEGNPMYKDGSHLRANYVREKADFIDITVK